MLESGSRSHQVGLLQMMSYLSVISTSYFSNRTSSSVATFGGQLSLPGIATFQIC